ncbi:MAG: alpha/beta hydrolase [Bdellovibrionales bacterium]|nr:alpha/beta hydrolase [Bdellovibrionales bacterium]
MSMTAKATGTFSSFDGTNIYYEVRGDGPPLIMAYGIGCLTNHWTQQIRYFSQKYTTIVFDYRAHHKSEMPASRENLNIDSLAQDVKSLLDHLSLEKVSLWGHSFGVQVAVRVFDMYPDRIHNLVLINGFVSNPMQGMFGNEIASSFFRLFKEGYRYLPETFSFLWKASINNPIAIQLSALAGGFNLHLTSFKDIEVYARGIASMDLNSFLTLFDNMMSYDGKPVLDRIHVPTLIIGGKKDSVTPQAVQEELHRRIRSSQLLMVPYGSHCTQLDMPDLVNLKIEQFLSSLPF